MSLAHVPLTSTQRHIGENSFRMPLIAAVADNLTKRVLWSHVDKV
jgi:hypothetical protein